MYNKELFDKILDVSCSFEELENFVIDINKKEFDLENPFEKYYDVNRIIFAIEKYQSKEIDARFLACWMNAYNWIIMGGFKINHDYEAISLKEFLIWEIVDWIDSLSFFDDSEDYYDLEEYKNTYKVLDYVLRDIDNCNAVYAETHYGEGAVVVLIMNDNLKYFIKVYGDLDYKDETIQFEKVEPTHLKDRVKHLQNHGYRELKYGNWDDED